MAGHTYKLYYFNLAGRGEFIRYMLHHAGIPFEDFRIDSQLVPGQWDAIKPKMPMGQVPVLEIDGKTMIPQSVAIGRYVAKKAGYYGSDDVEAAMIDAYVDAGQDLLPKIRPVIIAMFQKKDDVKKEEWAKVRDEVVKQLDVFEKAIAANGTGHLVGNKLSLADFSVGEWAARLASKVDHTILEGHPKLKELAHMIENLKGVKEYVATRPHGTF